MKEIVEQLISALRQLQDESGTAAKKTGENLDSIGSSMYKSTEKLVSANRKLSQFMTEEQKSMDTLVGSIKDVSDAIGESLILKMGASIPYIGIAVDAFQTLQATMVKVAEGYNRVIKDVDSMSAPLRAFQTQAFDIGKAFGMSFEESDKFLSSIVKTVVASEDMKDTFISYPEMIKNAEGFSRMGMSLDKMSESVDLGSRNMNILAAATLASSAAGENLDDTMRLITKSVMEQGMSTQQAVEQYGLFRDSAEKTGLSVTYIRSALEESVQAYSKMGMAAEFAKPALDAFASSLDKTGLGIKNARNLASRLTSTFADMANSYDKAFVTMSKGGMDFSGGVFGASIEMQARMMEAEKTGDQSAIAQEMISAMKGTLQSFTGDNIVTVQEARESPELQKTFVMQQKLLQEMYGLQGADATRTLEMLKDLDAAKAVGDDEAVAKLEEMIDEEVKGRNETKDIQERIAKNTQNNVMATLLLNDSYRGMMRASRVISSDLGRGAENVVEAGGNKAINMMDSFTEELRGMLNLQDGQSPYEFMAQETSNAVSGVVSDAIDIASTGAEYIKDAGKSLYDSLSQAGDALVQKIMSANPQAVAYTMGPQGQTGTLGSYSGQFNNGTSSNGVMGQTK